jgi:transposase
MDVHKEKFTVCCYHADFDEAIFFHEIEPNCKMVLKYLEQAREYILKNFAIEEVVFKCGYEAGCFGYTLYRQLKECGIDCEILAPSSMPGMDNKRIKTDKRDASNIAKCLAFKTYRKVHVPTKEDEAIKDFIRMRDSQKKLLKSTKQQIHALLMRHGYRYDEGTVYWTQKHLQWIRTIKMESVLQETLDEYLITYQHLADKVERPDKRIEELAGQERYQEKVKKLSCLIGVKTHTALSMITEVGDFNRFATPDKLAAFLGLVPGEASSGNKTQRLGITKAGNSHLRKLLVESAQGYTRGKVGYKSQELKRRQQGNTPEVIAYADKANERLRRKFYKMTLQNRTKRNVATTAIAREIACFMWGLMTDNFA